LIGAWMLAQVRAGRLAAQKVPAFIGLALDSKTLKGSWPEINTSTGKVRLFSALVHSAAVTVAQRKIPSDTSEVTQMLPLLDTISQAAGIGKSGEDENAEHSPDLGGAVITADALHVHRDNIEGALDRGAEYVLTVKKNQPKLRTQLEKLFTDADSAGDFPPWPHHLRPGARSL
jgi:hypothetical protein